MKISVSLLWIVLVSGISSGDALVLSSHNAAESWQRENLNCPYSLNSVAVDLVTGRAIAAGDSGTILLRDEDGEWTDVSPIELESNLNSVAVGVNGICLACGDNGTLLSSFDRGESWRVVEEFDYSGIDLLSVNFDPTHPSKFVITGENGFVFSTDGGGLLNIDCSNPVVSSSVMLCSGFPEFVVTSSGSIFPLSTFSIPEIGYTLRINSGIALVSGGSPFTLVGDNGLILTMEQEWETASATVEANLNSVAAVSFGSVLCAVGDNGVILVSRDNGDTWESVSSGTSRNLNCVAGDGAGRAFIVGDAIFPGVLFP